jgi:proline iminopeptidase
MKTVSATGIPLWARTSTLLIAALAAYALVVRPRLVRWGATDAEVRRPYPGAEIIPGGQRSSSTMGITIEAPLASVWPWLVQMGYGRAGWYSWDHLDNLGHPSAGRLHPEWQKISLGDFLIPMPGGRGVWEVAALEPERFLGLRASVDLLGRPFDPKREHPRFFSDSLWGFLLDELPGGRTRLVVSGYWALEPRWLQPVATLLLYEWTHWIMQMRQFENLKGRAAAALSPPSATCAPSATHAAHQDSGGAVAREPLTGVEDTAANPRRDAALA